MKNTKHSLKKRHFGTILMFAFLICGNLLYAQQSRNAKNEAQKLVTKALAAYEMGNYRVALEEIEKAQELSPDSPELYKASAEIYEELGEKEDLSNAIRNYNIYLSLLSPKAKNRDEIQNKIRNLEHKYEKILEQKMLDDLNGIWVSNLVLKKDENIRYVILKIQENQKTKEYQVTIYPESGMYKESIINKTVNLERENNGLFFYFSDNQVYNPSGTLDIISISASNSNMSQLNKDLVGAGTDWGRRNLPHETQTLYSFELKYNNGILKGILNIVQKRNDYKGERTTQDNIKEIDFVKNNDFFDYSNSPIVYSGLQGLSVKNNLRHKKYLLYNDLKTNPDYKKIKSGWVLMNVAGGITGGGIGCIIWPPLFNLFLSDENKISPSTKKYILISGCALTGVGVTLMICERKKMKNAVEEYNESLVQRNKTSWEIKGGVTNSGNLGLVLNF